MAVNFPTDLGTPAGSTHTLIDLNNNKVKGIGFFNTLAEAQGLNSAQRCLGYLAVVSNGTDTGTIYQYTATDLANWASSESWTQLGGSTDTGTTTDARVLHMNLRQSIMLSQTFSGDNGQFILNNPVAISAIPSEVELRFDGMRTLGYTLNADDNPYWIRPQFINDLKATAINQFEAVNSDVPLTSVNVKATCFIGDPTYRLGNADPQSGHTNGISAASTAALDAMNWNATDHLDLVSIIVSYWQVISQPNTGPDIISKLAYMPIIPIQGNDGTYRYISFDHSTDTGSGVTQSNFYDPANWTMVWNGSTGVAPIAVQAWLHDSSAGIDEEVYAGGPVPSLTTGANVGASGTLAVNTRIDTIAELDRLRIKLKITDAAKTAILNAVTDDRHPATWRDMYLHVDLGITITQ